MNIYIEYFLLQNTVINFCLLRLIHITTKSQTTSLKVVTASFLGAVFSVISANFIYNTILTNIIKFSSAVLMLATTFKQTKKGFAFNLILLFIYTYALGGIITNLSTSKQYSTFGVFVKPKVNMWTIMFAVIALTYIFEQVAKHLKTKIKSGSFIYKTTLKNGNKKLTINGFLDTGNMLNHNGKPVFIVDFSTFTKLTNIKLLEFLSLKSETINTSTVTGNSNLKLFTIDEITIFINEKKLTLKQQYIAVNAIPIFSKTNYKILLSPLML